MFIITEKRVRTRSWGKWLCLVHQIENNTVEDITEAIYEDQEFQERNWPTTLKDRNLVISYGSWTGAMRLMAYLRKKYWNDVDIHDVSPY